MKKKSTSYSQILKSTSIFGGSQVITIIIGIIRTKIIAVLLGTMGVGVIGIFQSIIDMMRSGAGLGMDTMSVRDMAYANSLPDKAELSKTVSLFNRWFLITALAGFLICIIFCYPISVWAFGSGEYAIYIALLSFSVFFAILTVGRSTVLQGMRHISDMAKSSIIGSFLGLLVTAPLYYFLGLDGITPAFLLVYLISFLCVQMYYRRLNITKVKVSAKATIEGGIYIFKFSIYLFIAGVVATGTMFLIKALLVRNMNIDAAGLFQAAWTISTIYLGLILRSMGSDFFPRLSAIANKKRGVRKLVNEQSYIVIIIASPLIVAMLFLSGQVISILYSSEFVNADTVLRWQMFGTFLKVLSWPIAFIMLAKNKGLLFLITEALFYGVYILSCHLLFPTYGLDATGIGYLIAYVVYLPIVYYIGWRIARFVWTGRVLRMTLVSLVLISFAFYVSQYCEKHAILLGIISILTTLVYSIYNLKKVFSLQDLKNWFRKD